MVLCSKAHLVQIRLQEARSQSDMTRHGEGTCSLIMGTLPFQQISQGAMGSLPGGPRDHIIFGTQWQPAL